MKHGTNQSVNGSNGRRRAAWLSAGALGLIFINGASAAFAPTGGVEASHASPAVPVVERAAAEPMQDPEPIGVGNESGAANNPIDNEMTDAALDSIDRGLRYLKSQQNSDGSFGRGRYGKHVGITALCCLAFMADGHVPGRGEYGDVVEKGLEFVLTYAAETGLLASDSNHGPMYGHGFAALFLGEIYGMNPTDTRVREALVRATRLIVNTQNEEGGWRYNPVPYDADVSVTICQVMALRSARNAGIKVPKETIDRAVEYVRKCQNPDGGFKYMLNTGGSAWPRTAAGVATLFYAGIHEDDAIDRGLDYLMREAMPGAGFRSAQSHYHYGHYYAVQAMYLAGGEHWARWWPAIREDVISKQSANGSWLDHYAGGAYATSMSLIILQMPKRYLPIFQK